MGGLEFIHYEEFLANPSGLVNRIAKTIEMTIDASSVPVFDKTLEVPQEFRADLDHKAQTLYAELG